MASTTYSFPQKSSKLRNGERGIASLTHKGRTFRFRTNPNQFSWTYTLNRRIDQTYGGRVIQLLGTKIDDFVFKADSGNGGWDYSNRVAKFLRDVMIDQRDGTPATFEYTKRGWKLNCYIVSVPFQDSVEEVLREFEVTCKVQEDVSGLLTKNFLDAELSRLADGIGFRRSKYNDPTLQGQTLYDQVGDGRGANPIEIINNITGIVQDVTGSGQFLPNGLQGGIPGIGNIIGNIGK